MTEDQGRSLDRIRAAELDAAQRVEAARSRANGEIADAHRRAEALVEEARSAGARQADARFAAVVAEATRTAHAISAEDRIARLDDIHSEIPRLVEAMVEFVLESPPVKGG